MRTELRLKSRLPSAKTCLRYSSNHSGCLYPTDHTLLHVHNNQRSTVYVLRSEIRKIESARETVAGLTGLDLADVKYSYPAMARQISAWLGIEEARSGNLREDLIPVWHFQLCTPARMPNYGIYDMRAAYWQIACRARSLLCEVIPESERIVWMSAPSDVERRWNLTKIALTMHKRLRLAVIGVNSVGFSRKRKGVYYCKGECRDLTGTPPTWFSSLSLLTIRVAYELTQMQAQQSHTIYANADCVALPASKKPDYWNDYGIEYACKAFGNIDTRSIGVWKCGNESTLTYDYFKRAGIPCLALASPHLYERPIYHERFVV